MIKAYIKCHTEELGVFSQFEEKYREKREKSNFFVYPGLRYADKIKQNLQATFFFENITLSTKFNLKKEQKKIGAITWK